MDCITRFQGSFWVRMSLPPHTLYLLIHHVLILVCLPAAVYLRDSDQKLIVRRRSDSEVCPGFMTLGGVWEPVRSAGPGPISWGVIFLLMYLGCGVEGRVVTWKSDDLTLGLSFAINQRVIP